MSLEDKRQLYACGTKFTTTEQVETWSQQVSVGKTELPSGTLLLLYVSIFVARTLMHCYAHTSLMAWWNWVTQLHHDPRPPPPSHFNSIFPGEPWLTGPCDCSSSTSTGRKPMGICGTSFHRLSALLSPNRQCQSTVMNSELWYHSWKLTHWPHPVLMNCRTLEKRGVAPLVSVVWCLYPG